MSDDAKLLIIDAHHDFKGTMTVLAHENMPVEYPVEVLYESVKAAIEQVRKARTRSVTVDMGRGLVIAGKRGDMCYTLGILQGLCEADLARRLGDKSGVDHTYIRVGPSDAPPLRAV